MEALQNKDRRLCPHCGEEALKEDVFCSGCGRALPLPKAGGEQDEPGFFRRTRLRPFALVGMAGSFFTMILFYLVSGALHLGSDWNSAVSDFLLKNIQGNFARLGIIYHSTGILLILTGVAQVCIGLMCAGFALRCKKPRLRFAGGAAAAALFLQSALYGMAGAFPVQLLKLIKSGLMGHWVFAAFPLGVEILACAASLFLAVCVIRLQVNLSVSKFAAMVAVALFALSAVNAAFLVTVSHGAFVGGSGRFFLQLGYLALAVSALAFREQDV